MKRKLSNCSLPSQIFILLLLAGSVFGSYERVSYPLEPGAEKLLVRPEGLNAYKVPAIIVYPDHSLGTDGYSRASGVSLDYYNIGIMFQHGFMQNLDVVAYYDDINGNGIADLITLIGSLTPVDYSFVGMSEVDQYYLQSPAETVPSFTRYFFNSQLKLPDSFCVIDLDQQIDNEFITWYKQEQLLEIIIPVASVEVGGNNTLFSRNITPLLASSPETSNFYHGDFDRDGKEDFVIAGYLFHNLGNLEFKKYPLNTVTGKDLRFVGTTDNYPFTDYKSHLIFAREGVPFEGDEIVIAEFNPESGIQEVTSIKFEHLFNVTKAWIGRNSNLSYVAAFSPMQGSLAFNEGFFQYGADKEYHVQSATLMFDNLNGCVPGGPVDWTEDSQIDWVFLDTKNDSLITFQYNEPLYIDKTSNLHLDKYEPAGLAVAVGDYNRDGYEDVFIANAGGPDLLLQNHGGLFTDVAAEAGVANNNDGISAAWGDYDNDGNLDLVVTGFSLAIKLYRNTGNGTFEDKSSILPTRDPNQRITSVSWGDINRDGWLDMLLGNYDGPDMIYFNASASLPGTAYTGRKFTLTKLYFDNRTYYNTESATLVDVNNDMSLDFVSVSVDGPVNLLINSYGKFYFDSTGVSGFNISDRTSKIGQSMCWGDLDGDRYPDMYLISNQANDILYLNTSFNVRGNKFSAQKFGSPGGSYGEMSGVIDDLTGDGSQDILLARSSQFGDLIAKPQDVLLSYNTYLSPSSDGGRMGLTGDELSCLPVSADFDRDGDLDLLFVNYLPNNSSNLFFGSKAPLRYLENQSQESSLISISLCPASGKVSTGARAELTYNRKIYSKVVSGGIGRIQSGQKLSFNIGREVPSADSLMVYWPSGNISKVNGPIYPGEMKVYEKRYLYTITPVELPGIYPDQEELYVGPDSFEVVVDIEDSLIMGASDSVNLTIKENLYTSDKIVKQMQRVDSTMNRFRAYIKNPGKGQTRHYFISIRQNGFLSGNFPENTTTYKKLTISDEIRLGDVNFNGRLDFFDALRIVAIYNGSPSASDEEQFRADFNQDGDIYRDDAESILNYLNPNFRAN